MRKKPCTKKEKIEFIFANWNTFLKVDQTSFDCPYMKKLIQKSRDTGLYSKGHTSWMIDSALLGLFKKLSKETKHPLNRNPATRKMEQ